MSLYTDWRDMPPWPEGRLNCVTRDGERAWLLGCPLCGNWALIDDDQLHGRVSVNHDDTGCSFHETRDWLHTAKPHNEHTARVIQELGVGHPQEEK